MRPRWSDMPRYVILEHDHPFPHWDLMLETTGVLRTWRLDEWPAPGMDISAEPLGDHRLDYLQHQGPISGGRGTVSRRDQGSYTVAIDAPQSIEIELNGQCLQGNVRIWTDIAGRCHFRFEAQPP